MYYFFLPGLYSYTSERMTSDRFLQVLACCDIMCEVLGEGLATLGTPKYVYWVFFCQFVWYHLLLY